MKNLEAKKLGTLLVSLRACETAIDWAKGMSFTSDPRPAECIAVVRRWLKDEATISDVRAAADAAADAAYAESLQFSADICRKHISVEYNQRLVTAFVFV